jgi:hypothetical protein
MSQSRRGVTGASRRVTVRHALAVLLALLPALSSASENVYKTSSYNQLVTSSTLRYPGLPDIPWYVIPKT